jgi:hypothetical protein
LPGDAAHCFVVSSGEGLGEVPSCGFIANDTGRGVAEGFGSASDSEVDDVELVDAGADLLNGAEVGKGAS